MAQTPINDRDIRFRDGLGIRVVTTDASGDAVEQLCVSSELAIQETSIRERVGRLVNFRHVKYVRLRGVDRLKQGGKELVVSYDAVDGDRLSTILEAVAKIPLTLDVDVALQVVRDLLPGIGILHDSRKVTHGAIGPERLAYTPQNRLIILDHGLALALGRLNQPRKKLWEQFRIAVPGSARGVFDERTDVIQIGVVALSALLARPLTDDEYPSQLKRLILSVKEHTRHGARPISPELRQWLERALPVDEERPFRTVRDAQEAFEALVGKGRYAPSAAAVKAFLTRYREATAAAVETTPSVEPVVEEPRTNVVERALEEFAITIGPKAPVSRSKSTPAIEPVPQAHPVAAAPEAVQPPAQAEPPAEAARTLVIASAIEGHVTARPDTSQAPANTRTESSAPRAKTTRKSDPLSESPQARERVGDAARRARQSTLRSDVPRPAALPEDAAAVTPRKTSGRLDALRALEEELSRLAALDLVLPRRGVTPAAEAPVREERAALTQASEPASAAALPIAGAQVPLAVVAEELEAAAVLLSEAAESFTSPIPVVDVETAFVIVEPLAVTETAAVISAAPAPVAEEPAAARSERRPFRADAIDAALAELMGERDADECAIPIWTIDNADVADASALAQAISPAADLAAEIPVAPAPPVEARLEPAAALPADVLEAMEALAAFEAAAVQADAEAGAVSFEPSLEAEPTLASMAAAAVPVEASAASVETTPPAAEEPTFELTSPAPAPIALAESFELIAPAAEAPVEPPMLPELSALEQAAEDIYAAVAQMRDSGRLFEADPAREVASVEAAVVAPLPAAEPAVAETAIEEVANAKAAITAPVVVVEVAETAIAETAIAETANAQAVSAENAIAETAVAETAIVETAIVETATAETTSAVVAEPAMAETAIVSAGIADTATVEAVVVQPAVAETTVEAPVFVEAPAIAETPALVEPLVAAAAPEATLVAAVAEMPIAEPVAAMPNVEMAFEPVALAEPATLEIPGAEPAPLDLVVSESATAEAAFAEIPITPNVNVETSVVEPLVADAAIVDATIAVTAIAETAIAETTIVETAIAEIAVADFASAELAIVEPAIAETSIPETAIAEAAIAETSIAETAIAETALEPPVRRASSFGDRVRGFLGGAFGKPRVDEFAAAPVEPFADVVAEEIADTSGDLVVTPALAEASTHVDAALPIDVAFESFDLVAVESGPAAAAAAGSQPVAPATVSDVVAEPAPEPVAAAPEPQAAPAADAQTAQQAASNESRSKRKRSRKRNKRRQEPAPPVLQVSAPVQQVSATPVVAPVVAEEPVEIRAEVVSSSDAPVPQGKAVDRVAFYEFDSSQVADSVPAWARGTASATTEPESDLQGIGDVQFQSGPALDEPAHLEERPAWQFRDAGPVSAALPPPQSQVAQSQAPVASTSNVVPFQPAAERDAFRDAADVAPVSVAPRRRSLISRVNWGRTLAASLLLALLEGVAFAAAWWYVTPTELGWLVVHTRPAGIEISIDGMSRGQTPFAVSLRPGRHTIELRQGTATRVIPVEISAGVQTEQRITWGNAFKTGQARITSTPEGAHVVVDGKSHGRTPVTISELSAGKHSVTVEASTGSVTSSLMIEAGETTELDVPVYSGWVSVLSPVELEIFERGRLIGTSEADKIMLAPGRHELELKNESLGYQGAQAIEVRPGATTAVSVLPTAVVTVEGPDGAELFIDGERAGVLPMPKLQAPIGTREFVFKHPDQGERRQVVVVTMTTPTAVRYETAGK